MKTKVILLLLLFFFTNNTAYSKKIEIIAKVNNDIITNIDLYKEYQLYEFISKSKLNLDSQVKQRFLNTLINHQIKKSELKKYSPSPVAVFVKGVIAFFPSACLEHEDGKETISLICTPPGKYAFSSTGRK